MGWIDWDARAIIAGVSAIAAVASAAVAIVSVHTARQSLSLAQQQDARRGPRVVPYLADGYARRDAGRRLYAISLSLTNPSDSDNSVAMLELEIRYRIREGVLMTMRLPHDASLRDAFGRPDIESLTTPLRVLAHGTVAGWSFFALPTAAIGEAEIDDYVIRLVDAQGIAVTMEVGSLTDIGSAT